MSTKIEINDIIDANSHNSAMALTAAWANCFKKYAMEEYEDLSDNPASSFNVFTHLTAQGAAKMMYEQAARISETNVSTAILPKSLMNQLTTEEMTGIFGTPASTTIAFCIVKDDIIKNAVLDENEKVYRLVINKNLVTTFESHPSFTLPYDVIVNYKPVNLKEIDSETGDVVTNQSDNIYAYYDMPDASNDGMRNVFGIYNQYISSREMRYEGKIYVAFFLKVFQIQRKEVTFYVNDPYTADTTITFENLLCGFEVFRTKSNSHVETMMNGVTEGNSLAANSYNFSYDFKRNSQNFNLIFSKMNDASALTVGDTIRVVIYSTEGDKGNLEFPYMIYNVSKLSVMYNQDMSKANQNAMINIICLAFARDKAAVGGKNSLTFEEIRTLIENKRYSRDILITNMEIKNKGQEKGLQIEQVQHDLTAMTYKSIDMLKYKNMVLSTGMDNIYFDFTQKQKMLGKYNYYLIEPTDVFKLNQKNNRFEYISGASQERETYLDYVNKYNKAVDKKDVLEVSFPFYIRYENTVNPKIQVYDMFVNDIQYLKFAAYREQYALDKLDIPFLKVLRRPYKNENSKAWGESNSTNKYVVQFIVYTGENTLNKMYAQSHNSDSSLNYVNARTEKEYMKQYVTFELSLLNINDNHRYIVNPTNVLITNADTMLADGYIAYQATFETNNFISDDKQIQLNGIRNATSISKDYSVYTPVDSTVQFRIVGKFNDLTNNPYGNDCIAYETDNVQLVKYLTDDFKIDFDIILSDNVYETWDNVPFEYGYGRYGDGKSTIKILNPLYDPTKDPSDQNNPSNRTDPAAYKYLSEVDDDNKVILRYNTDEAVPLPIYKVAHHKNDFVCDYIPINKETDEINDESIYYKRKHNTKMVNGEEVELEDESIDELSEYPDIPADYDPHVYEQVTGAEVKSDTSDTVYYKIAVKLLHKAGELKYYHASYGSAGIKEIGSDEQPVALPNNEVIGNDNYVTKKLQNSYIGVCKNVPWINRLYMAGETMYEKIVAMYCDIIERTEVIRKSLFEGGKMYIGLSNTSGSSKKFRAHILSTNTYEYLNDIALRFEFRVKYNDEENIDYKNQQIVNSTMDYVRNIGDNNFSVDKLFDAIKDNVPDIEYINIIKINEYSNGEVQTILNDASVTNEVLTVSQKMVIDDEGDIDFEPNITINVV